MGYLEDKILNFFVEKALVWWRCIDIFMVWQYGEEKLKEFCHSTANRTAIRKIRKTQIRKIRKNTEDR